MRRRGPRVFFLILPVLSMMHVHLADAQSKALTFEDMMHFRSIIRPVLSLDGKWAAYELKPDRGDGQLVIRSTDRSTEYRVQRGSEPVFSNDGQWVAVRVRPTAEAVEKAGKDAGKLKDTVAIVHTAEQVETAFVGDIASFQFTEDSQWLLMLRSGKDAKGDRKGSTDSTKGKAKRTPGSDLILRHLQSAAQWIIPDVKSFTADTLSRMLVYAVEDSTGEGNGVFMRPIAEVRSQPIGILADSAHPILKAEHARISQLVWNHPTSQIAFVAAPLDKKEKPGPGAAWIWDPATDQVQGVAPLPEGWIVPSINTLAWSKDGERLYFGLRPATDTLRDVSTEDSTVRLFDVPSILSKRGVDIWHWDDGLIIPNQKKMWKRQSEQTYSAVYHSRDGLIVQLADTIWETASPAEGSLWAPGRTGIPYQKEITWDGSYADYAVVDQRTGERRPFLKRQAERVSFSPEGRFAAFFRDSTWFVYSVEGDSAWRASPATVPFYQEENDTPSEPGSYGSAGWMKDERAIIVYDRFDIWMLPTDGSPPRNLTKGEGRKKMLRYRVVKLEKEFAGFLPSDRLFLSAYSETEKTEGVYSLALDSGELRTLASGPSRYGLVAQAANKQTVLYTRESYREFPDLWAADRLLGRARRLSEANPQIKEFAWGHTQLVKWNSLDGIPLEGVLITPDTPRPEKGYPVIVYFYELMSQRLHEFNEVVVNHRPCFPFYASNGYAIFLPDVRYHIGHPGFSATKCVVPGVQKLIDMGIADPHAIGLHGHSWGGYETAFIVTQTNLFACAIAGAPVGNMTSAYSGIRWGSGLARQFQYEKEQSRIGGSLWEYPERYIENSPVFFADRITTPLLLMHGDEDDAVPWYQSIELYLALRRLSKDCIFLEYRNEPHHPRTYANKLDYAIRMKEYFDHYLKKERPAEWIVRGIPYDGK